MTETTTMFTKLNLPRPASAPPGKQKQVRRYRQTGLPPKHGDKEYPISVFREKRNHLVH